MDGNDSGSKKPVTVVRGEGSSIGTEPREHFTVLTHPSWDSGEEKRGNMSGEGRGGLESSRFVGQGLGPRPLRRGSGGVPGGRRAPGRQTRSWGPLPSRPTRVPPHPDPVRVENRLIWSLDHGPPRPFRLDLVSLGLDLSLLRNLFSVFRTVHWSCPNVHGSHLESRVARPMCAVLGRLGVSQVVGPSLV